MGFRFHRSIKLFPGIRVNLSAGGASLSVGAPGATLNFSARGANATFGLPGSGMSYRMPLSGGRQSPQSRADNDYIDSTDELREALAKPFTSVVYVGSRRRLSAQQLNALHNRLAQREAREHVQAEVDRLEADLNESLNAWRVLPPIPGAEQCSQALSVRPFVNPEPRPTAPNLITEEVRHAERVHADVELENPRSAMSRMSGGLAGIAVALASGLLASLWVSQPAAAVAAGLGCGGLAWWIATSWSDRRRASAIQAKASERAAAAWPAVRAEFERQFAEATQTHSQRETEATLIWNTQEQTRIEWATKLVNGDVPSIEEAVSASLSDLDFPFDATCSVGVDDATEAFINIDLPEIEDVVPETKYNVLKNGSLKSVKRKAEERNAAYASLVIGIAFTIAATAYAAAPTVQSVVLAGYTQRKRRASLEVDDVYVYEMRIRRNVFASLDVSRASAGELVTRAETRIDMSSNAMLKKIEPPIWVAKLPPTIDLGGSETASA